MQALTKSSSKYTLLYLIVLIMIMLSYKPPYEVFSSSSFVRQEISDGTNDWILATSNLPLQAPNIARNISACAVSSPDIESVSYISDRKTLNATL